MNMGTPVRHAATRWPFQPLGERRSGPSWTSFASWLALVPSRRHRGVRDSMAVDLKAEGCHGPAQQYRLGEGQDLGLT